MEGGDVTCKPVWLEMEDRGGIVGDEEDNDTINLHNVDQREELLTILNQLGTQKLDILVNRIRRFTRFNPSVSIFVNDKTLPG